MQYIWILGLGPILVDKQFVVDYRRLKLFLNNDPMPDDIREGLRRLYETCDNHYFSYTKYMNQTMGNCTFQMVKNLTQIPHLLPKLPFTIHADTEAETVTMKLHFDLLDENLKSYGHLNTSLVINMVTYQKRLAIRGSI